MSIKQAIEALQCMVDEKADYMIRNKLGNPFVEHSTKQAIAALAALRSMPAEPVDDALNTLCKMMHSGEEVEGDDGLAMLVPMDLWNEAQEAIELLVGEDDATPPTEAVRMSEAEILEIMRDGYNCRYNDEADHIDFARAIERAVFGRGESNDRPD